MNPASSTRLETQQTCYGAYAPVNGLKMYYEIHGTGTPLVLIHGGGSTIDTTFGRILPTLAANHQVIAVEMQAHGRTSDIDRPLTFEQDADDIAALLEYLNVTKADIFGFSNGACITLQCAIRHPKMVHKIIVASTFYNRNGAPSWMWDMLANASFDDMPQPFKDAFLKVNPDAKALNRMFERDVARMRSFQDITNDQIQSIDAPAMIIIGDRDVVTPEHAVQMHRMILNSRLVIFPCGHGDYIGEITTQQDPVLISSTVNLIQQFLSSQ